MGVSPNFFCLLWNKLNSPNNGCIENIWAQCTVKKKTFELAIILCNSGSGVQGAGEKLLFHLEKSCNDQSLRMTTYAEAREILHLHIHHLSNQSVQQIPSQMEVSLQRTKKVDWTDKLDPIKKAYAPRALLIRLLITVPC